MDTAEYIHRLANQVFSAAMRELPKGIQHETAYQVVTMVRERMNDELYRIMERAGK